MTISEPTRTGLHIAGALLALVSTLTLLGYEDHTAQAEEFALRKAEYCALPGHIDGFCRKDGSYGE